MAGNPFVTAFSQADLFGKLIFLGLFLLSIISWMVLVHKVRMTRSIQSQAARFSALFWEQRHQPLDLEAPEEKGEFANPFRDLYHVLRQQTMEVLGKNQQVQGEAILSPADIHLVEAHLITTISTHSRKMEQNLFLLSMVISLAPFLGLLGTVWGILVTFGELTLSGSGSNQMVLSGLSMALATTVLGLVVAIPALIGYSTLKQQVSNLTAEMENFCSEMLAAVEMNYRKVDVS